MRSVSILKYIMYIHNRWFFLNIAIGLNRLKNNNIVYINLCKDLQLISWIKYVIIVQNLSTQLLKNDRHLENASRDLRTSLLYYLLYGLIYKNFSSFQQIFWPSSFGKEFCTIWVLICRTMYKTYFPTFPRWGWISIQIFAMIIFFSRVRVGIFIFSVLKDWILGILHV